MSESAISKTGAQLEWSTSTEIQKTIGTAEVVWKEVKCAFNLIGLCTCNCIDE